MLPSLSTQPHPRSLDRLLTTRELECTRDEGVMTLCPYHDVRNDWPDKRGCKDQVMQILKIRLIISLLGHVDCWASQLESTLVNSRVQYASFGLAVVKKNVRRAKKNSRKRETYRTHRGSNPGSSPAWLSTEFPQLSLVKVTSYH